MRRFIILAAICSVALVSAVSAAAAPPETSVGQEFSSEVFPAGTICPFAVGIVIDADVRTTTFFDGAGNATMVRTHVIGGSVSTNLATGRQLVRTWALTVAFDPISGVAALTGRQILTVDPNGGVLALSAGRLVQDWAVPGGVTLFQAGRWDIFAGSQFCEALT